MPRSAGWYDDPDGSSAERYWNGRNWTPERRRKATPAVQPAVMNYPPLPPPAYQYPTTGQFQDPGSGPTQPPLDPPALTRGSLGTREIVGIAIALSGLALILVAFMEWGRARVAFMDSGDSVVSRASFPGVGDVKVTFNVSDLAGEFQNFAGFHNTNPGWIAIVFGVLVMAAGIGIWRLNYRSELAIAAAVAGLIAAALFINDLLDVRGTFGDQSGFAGAELSAGVGLLAACALAVAIAGLGIAAFVLERRDKSDRSRT
jgi:hypothetical protein